jgi:hypothetical protein
MGIYRGPGGVGDAVNDASSEASATVIARDEAVAARNAAIAAKVAAELAEDGAQAAQATAEAVATDLAADIAAAQLASTYAANAATSATNASNSATAASGSASTATTQANNASAAASTATTQATNAASSATSAESAKTAAESARDATLAAYDSFDDRYLGVKSSNPTLDNDGNALIGGALYFSSTENIMKVYTGSAWVAAYVSGAGVLLISNNLSDLASAATARTNLGLGTAATTASTDYATAAQGTKADTAHGWGNHASAGYATYPSQTGNAGKYLTTDGSTTSWGTVVAGASLSNDTSTASNLYPLFAAATSGVPTTIYTSNSKYLYNPSTGTLQSPVFNASNGIYINNMTVSTSVSIPAGSSAMSVGPITVAAGQTVTVPSGSRWVIL